MLLTQLSMSWIVKVDFSTTEYLGETFRGTLYAQMLPTNIECK